MWDTILYNIIDIKAFKHDGTLYRQLNGNKVVFQNEQCVIVLSISTKVEEKNGQKWTCRDPILWWFFKDEFYNVSVTIKSNECYFYVNLSSPTVINGNSIEYIDYDLDIKKYPGTNMKIIDKVEYEKNKVEYKYPTELLKIIEKTIDQVTNNISKEETPFSKEYIKSFIDELITNGNYPKNKRIKMQPIKKKK